MAESEVKYQSEISVGGIQSQETLINSLKDRITSLQATLKAYKKTIDAQNTKIASNDKMFIDYTNISKKYADVEAEVVMVKNENLKLIDAVNNKNKLLAEFQRLTELSSDKFKLIEKKNKDLHRSILTNESKIKKMETLKEISDNKIRELEIKISEMKLDAKKSEDSYLNQLSSLEMKKNIDEKAYKDESDMMIQENNKLKSEIEKLKEENKTLVLDMKDKKNELMNIITKKDADIEILKDNIMKLNKDNQVIQLTSKDSEQRFNFQIEKLKEDAVLLNNELKEKNEKIIQLNQCIVEYNKTIKEAENEIHQREKKIIEITKENENLMKQITDFKTNINELNSKTSKIIDSLNIKLNQSESKIIDMTTEKEKIIADNEMLHNQLQKYQALNEKIKEEQKVNEQMQNDKINKLIIEKNELQNKIVYLNKTIAEKENYEHALKSKYGKKVNILQLQKEELNHRLSNLMDNLLALKEYANQIERSIRNKNINDAYVSSSLKKEDVMDTNRDEYNLQLINTLKGIINKIDTKILVTSTTDEENEDNEMISN